MTKTKALLMFVKDGAIINKSTRKEPLDFEKGSEIERQRDREVKLVVILGVGEVRKKRTGKNK